MIWPGYQLLRTSWSSHRTRNGTSAAKAALVLVHEVVGEGAAVIRQALRHLRLARRGQVFPGAAVIGGHLGLDRIVGIDLVARTDEEIRIGAAHRLVNAVAADIGIDAPALPGLVAGEGEGDGLAARWRCGSGG
jgi:hypothetical protein